MWFDGVIDIGTYDKDGIRLLEYEQSSFAEKGLG